MTIALTGTPGTGKTSVAVLSGRPVVSLNTLYERAAEGRRDDGTWEVDLALLAGLARAALEDCDEPALLEGHLGHRLDLADTAIVLRCHPRVLGERLASRGYAAAKVRANQEAEALGLITSEALEAKINNVHEIDTTTLTPAETAALVQSILRGETRHRAPCIDHLAAVLEWY